MPNSDQQAISLLIIGDNPGSLEQLSSALARAGLAILAASDPVEGIDLFCSRRPQIVLIDLVVPNFCGMDVPERVQEIDPSTDVILMTGHDFLETAVSINKGANNLNKLIALPRLRERIGTLMEAARRRRESLHLEDDLRSNSEFEGIIGRSPAMCDMISKIQRVAPHYRTVLLTGGTGTGKDLAAQALHRLSPVSSGRFVALNCSAVVETLFESELFGHVKGAFTGATHDKAGLFEHAHGGTLFLDEIGDMPLSTQAKLLRVLQNQEVQRVGALTARKVDVRVVAATNQNLRALIAENRFREDVYYRLSMVEIQTPRLEECKEDLPLLQRHFTTRFAAQYQKDITGLTYRAQIRLLRHAWPGNVRELENVIGHGAMMTTGNLIDVQDLPAYLHSRSERRADSWGALPDAGTLENTLENHERRLLAQAMKTADGNKSRAARSLRIGRDKLRYKLKQHSLDSPDSFRSSAAAG